jgi:pimeloyl-ACP methyl ester carboxylesterase
VIFLHGDGPATRHNFLSWARLFAANGIAALSIDKRGYGGSDGDGLSATLQNNADDAAAAVAYLAARPDIARGKIGLIGTSRGGWTAPMAALQRPEDIAFVIASSGGPIGVGPQERYSRLRNAAAAGASDEALGQAAQVIDDYFAYLTSDGRDKAAQVSANWTLYGEQPWYRAMRMPAGDPTTGAWPPARRVFADDLRLDARALYDRLTIPVLFLYGIEDALFPQAVTLSAAEGVARRLPGSEVRVFEGASHSFTLPARPGDTALTAPGYYETMIRWARQRLFPGDAAWRGSRRNARTTRGSGGSGR